MKFRVRFIVKIIVFIIVLFQWNLEIFLVFIHFSLLAISVNFLVQLVTDICDPVLKD